LIRLVMVRETHMGIVTDFASSPRKATHLARPVPPRRQELIRNAVDRGCRVTRNQQSIDMPD
jgi:hypothetical protein